MAETRFERGEFLCWLAWRGAGGCGPAGNSIGLEGSKQFTREAIFLLDPPRATSQRARVVKPGHRESVVLPFSIEQVTSLRAASLLLPHWHPR
jgi:hypothetical protein